MTKKARERIEKAVRLLYDDKWEEAMRILLPMAGLRSPAMDILDKARAVSLDEIKSGEFVFIDPGE